jgi:hypothetical protein
MTTEARRLDQLVQEPQVRVVFSDEISRKTGQVNGRAAAKTRFGMHGASRILLTASEARAWHCRQDCGT